MKFLKLAPLLLALVFLESCSTTPKSPTKTATGDWLLASMNNAPINRMVVVPTLQIRASEMLLSGNAGCNQYSGQIEKLDAKSFMVSDKIVSTMMACNNENIESEYLQKLSMASSYEVKEDKLMVYDKAGKNILSFIKNENTSANQILNDIWMATSINGGPINRMVSVPRLEINLAEMKIFGTDGCNDYNGAITETTSSKIKFGRIASTRKMCPEMDIANKYTAALNTVASYKLDGLKLTLMNSSGKEVLSFLKVD